MSATAMPHEQANNKTLHSASKVSYQCGEGMRGKELHHFGHHLQALAQVPLPLCLLLWGHTKSSAFPKRQNLVTFPANLSAASSPLFHITF